MTDASPFVTVFERNELFGTTGIRVAVKDLVDIKGTRTTAGSNAVARSAEVAEHDAPCMAGTRQAIAEGRVQLVGKTVLHELAFGAEGINPEFGTPTNPLDHARIPGGSSSGSAVAVATDQADVAFGSDTGGSIRIPAACCGITGLKTTWGRIPVDRTWPLAPFLDTLGPMARNIADLTVGMRLLDPAFEAETGRDPASLRVGRWIPTGVEVDPATSEAIDRALSSSGLTVESCTLPLWSEAHAAGYTVLLGEAWRGNKHLIPRGGVSEAIERRLRLGQSITDEELHEARLTRSLVLDAMATLWADLDVIVFPTIPVAPPLLADASTAPLTALTRYANLSGLPALSMPIPVGRFGSSVPEIPVSIQLLGPLNGESTLLSCGKHLESVW